MSLPNVVNDVPREEPVASVDKDSGEDGKGDVGDEFGVEVEANFGDFHPGISQVVQKHDEGAVP